MEPIITQRLIMEPAKPEDIDFIIGMEKDPDNSRFISTYGYDEHLEELNDETKIVLIINEIKSSKPIGYVLNCLNRDSNQFEIRRIAISKKNKGYGRESMNALFQYAFESLNLNKVWLDVYPGNDAGIHLYESLGMHKDGVLRENMYSLKYGYRDQIIYSILRSEYIK